MLRLQQNEYECECVHGDEYLINHPYPYLVLVAVAHKMEHSDNGDYRYVGKCDNVVDIAEVILEQWREFGNRLDVCKQQVGRSVEYEPTG